jgi:F-type H+-transporting ATPase subunit epsilon
MARAEYDVKVVTPDGEVWAGACVSMVVPGVDGYFGVWSGHAPLIAGMDIGAVMIMDPQSVIHVIAVGGGFVEVSRDRVTVLAESAELGDGIDTIRVDHALDRARERLSEHFAQVDVERAEVALRKALNRQRVAKRAREKPTSLV